MSPISKFLIIIGTVFIIAGLVWHFSGGNIPLGRLPGDIRIKNDNSSFYFPITTCLIISAILSLISYLFKK